MLSRRTAMAALALVIFRSNNDHVSSTKTNSAAVYTEDDVNRMVDEALARQASAKPPPVQAPPIRITVAPLKPKGSRIAPSTAKSQRPLSKEEREQLAAELRLLSSTDDETLHLLGDRINQ